MASRGAFALLIALMAVAVSQQPAHAGLAWNWSFGGTESGTLYTNGTLADVAGPFDFTLTGISVTASTLPTLVGAVFTENQPVQGFLWDGSTITQFYRSSGLFTNGSNFFSGLHFFGFYASGSVQATLREFPGSGSVIDYTAVTFGAPTTYPSAVPEPSTLALSLAGLCTVAGVSIRRRKGARQ